MTVKWYDAIFKLALCCIVAIVLSSFVSDYPVQLGLASGACTFIVWQYYNYANCKKSVFHGIE